MLKTAKNFTFHSGTILIPNLSSQNDASFAFTFHSGTILMLRDVAVSLYEWHFTFHSGTILILTKILLRSLCMKLYIPLWYDSNQSNHFLLLFPCLLYIPLWYDSNLYYKRKCVSFILLYIPLWYDSNVDRIFTYMWYLRLYIPLWYDSNLVDDYDVSDCHFFTFHSGTILIWPLFYYRNTLFSSTVLSTSNFILYFASMKL